MTDLLNQEVIQQPSASAASPDTKQGINWRFLRNCVIGTTLTVTAAGGFGAFVGSKDSPQDIAEKNTIEATISTTQEQISNYEKDTVIFEQRDAELEGLYGSACLAALLPYNTEPLLKATSIDQVVGDLLADTKQPCGSEPTEVRIAAIDVDKTKSNLERLSKISYPDLVARLHVSQEAYKDKNNNVKRLLGTLAMGGLGLGMSSFFIAPQRDRIRQNSRRRY